MIVEKGTMEKYPSKKAMMKHEKSEGSSMQKKEMKGCYCKKAVAGKDIGKKGKNFAPMAESVAKSYEKKGMPAKKAMAVGKATAAKMMFKNAAKK